MGLIRRNGTYYAEFNNKRLRPKQKRYSLHTTQKRDAWRQFAELDDAWKRGAFDPWTESPDQYRESLKQPAPETIVLAHAVARFIAEKAGDGRSENTLRTYREVLGLLNAHVGTGRVLRDVLTADLRGFIHNAGVANATRHKRFSHVRTFFRWCVRVGLCERNPLSDLAPPDKPHKLPKSVSEQELEAIVAHVREDYEVKRLRGVIRKDEAVWRVELFRFAFYTGMRASELARLRWDDIDFDRRLIFIRKQKNKREQTIPLHLKARDILDAVPRSNSHPFVFASPRFTGTRRNARCFAERASRAFRESRNAAGIDRPISFHGLRHGFCTKLAESGKPAYIIREAARHADISTTLRYVHMANEHLKTELDGVFV